MRLFLIITGVLTLALSCTDLKKGTQLRRIEDLLETVDRLERLLKDNRIDSLTEMNDRAQLIVKRIDEFHSSDTIELKTALLLNEYKMMIQYLPEIEKNQIELAVGIKKTRKSLRQLKTDISNATGEKKSYDFFIKFESEKTFKLKSRFNRYLVMRNKIARDYPKVYRKVSVFSEKSENDQKSIFIN